jgi:hypothetical protein
MFYVQATLQEPPGMPNRHKGEPARFPREAYVAWDSLSMQPAFLGIDNPPRPVSREEAESLLSECEKVHGSMYDHNLRIVPA